MDWITEPEKKIPVTKEVDLLVCGGGVAGFAAAYCAARNGARVLLVERYGFLGGMATAGLVITTPPLNNGICLELADRLKSLGSYVPCRYRSDDLVKLEIDMHAFDPEIFKHLMVGMLQEQGVELLFHTYIVDSMVEESAIKGIIIENKGGRQAIRAKVVLDASGDADVVHFSGAPCVPMDNKAPVTLMFNMVGVDIESALAHLENWSNVRKVVRQAIETGELTFDLGLEAKHAAPGVIVENLVYPDELNVWSGNFFRIDGTDPDDLTNAEIITRDHAMKLAQFLKRSVKGFEKSRIEYTATQVGVRKTRQIKPGQIKGASQDEAAIIAKPYATSKLAVPYHSLVPDSIEQLLVAGRCVHCQEDRYGGQLRLIPACLATGQAAGIAASLALAGDIPPRDVDVSGIQRAIREQGMDLSL